MPDSWDELHLRDIFYAYRKAKADRFYETSIRSAERFIAYEQNLAENLHQLFIQLQRGEIDEVIGTESPSIVVLPKKARFSTIKDSLHVHWSNFDKEKASWPVSAIVPEFRFVADFTVQHHIISALWINLIGHRFDEVLGKNAIASRLRRYRPKGSKKLGEYHTDAIGSFEPYFGPYREWRDGGLNALKQSLNAGDDVAAITLDIANFYHSVDPSFVLDAEFLEQAGLILNGWERDFTRSIINLIQGWNRQCAELMKEVGCGEVSAARGLPIGLSVSRLLSNVFLFSLDRELERNLSPVYYSRYVDDIFLVLSDRSGFPSQHDLIRFVAEKVPSVQASDDLSSLTYLPPSWGRHSQIEFSAEKRKVFFLSGKSGIDLLDSISEQIKAVSSERRLMPSVRDIQKLSSAKILANGSAASDEVDALRKADGLTLRRLGWSVLLRSLSVLAKDLDADDWEDDRKDVYRFAFDHVIRADRILEYLDKVPWLFTVAISVQDYSEAWEILRRTRFAIRDIKSASGSEIVVNGWAGSQCTDLIWKETDRSITRFFREALIRSYDFRSQDTVRKSLNNILTDLELTPEQLEAWSVNALNADWGRLPYRFAQETLVRRGRSDDEDILHSLYPRIVDLKEFLEKRRSVADDRYDIERSPDGVKEESLVPYLFPTRPYLTDEIALHTPDESVFGDRLSAARNWSRYVRALRGIWTKPDDLADLPISSSFGAVPETNEVRGGGPASSVVDLGGAFSDRPIRIGISSFAISQRTWDTSAAGANDVSPRRYDQIQGIVNQAISANPRPDYLVLPELALPARWIGTVSQLLRQAGISLISGVDYSYPSDDKIYSSAVMALRDDRLGYPSTIQIRQLKSVPAPHEDQILRDDFGKSWSDLEMGPKPIYKHRGFHFSVLVCSELSNIEYRRQSQGKVDALFVVSWNQDLETFSALIESAALDVHCYMALCNNRVFGDSRVRAPRKNSWERDICRLRGGLNDHLAVVEIDIQSLRRHQSRATRWPRGDDLFKPVPEGFSLTSSRRTNPARR